LIVAEVTENWRNIVVIVAEFIESVPVRDHSEPGATGESGSTSLARAQTRRGAVGLIRQAGAPGSANRRRRPTYEASTTRGRLRTSRAYNRFDVTLGSVNAQRDTYIGKELFRSCIMLIRRLYDTLMIVSYFILSFSFLSEKLIAALYFARSTYSFVCGL